ncbi:hypothetical protein D3C84_811640 [compost metagenome]
MPDIAGVVTFALHAFSPYIDNAAGGFADGCRQQRNAAEHDPGGHENAPRRCLWREIAIAYGKRGGEIEVGKRGGGGEVLFAQQHQAQIRRGQVHGQGDDQPCPTESVEEGRGIHAQ